MKRFNVQRTYYEFNDKMTGQVAVHPGFDFGGTSGWGGYRWDPPDVINVLTQERANVHYLEIGVDQGSTFDHITNVEMKHGVDPYGSCKNITHRMTSQLFFSLNRYFFHHNYDVIFIDGLHLSDILHSEIVESLRLLRNDGLIVLHDTCPAIRWRQQVVWSDFQNILENVITPDEKERLDWHENTALSEPVGLNGDVWKNVAHLRTIPQFTTFSIPNACCTVLAPRKLPKFDQPPLEIDLHTTNWEEYYERFEEIMNPVSLEYFKENIGEYLPRENG